MFDYVGVAGDTKLYTVLKLPSKSYYNFVTTNSNTLLNFFLVDTIGGIAGGLAVGLSTANVKCISVLL